MTKISSLMITALMVSVPAFAQQEKPSAQDERERLERLENAQTSEELMDNLTPDELAEMLGVPSGDDFQSWIETQPDLLFQPAQGVMVEIHVSIANQSIYVDSPQGSFSSRISSGRKGYPTKRGCFTPYHMTKMHYSKKYDNAPMPHSIFYYGGYAIHATYEEHKLGRPASHGCVRVSRATAKSIFNIVKTYGRNNTRVCVN